MSAGQETNIMHRIMLALGKLPTVRIFRNNTASGWAGQSTAQGSHRLVMNAFPLKAGLCPGSSDLIGMKQVIVTPEMLGKPMAIFTAIEVKTGIGRISPEQAAFINMVVNMGGIAFVARSEQEALEFINIHP